MRTYRSLPFLMSCLMGLRSSSLEIWAVDTSEVSRQHDGGGRTAAAGQNGRAQGAAHLKLGIGPARDLDNHVEDGLLGIGKQGDVVEGRQGQAILLDVHAVLEGVGGGDLAGGVRHDGVLSWCFSCGLDRGVGGRRRRGGGRSRQVAGDLGCAEGRNLECWAGPGRACVGEVEGEGEGARR